jgi:hypothetical protein
MHIYTLTAQLSTSDGAEWSEDTTVEAVSINEALRLAKSFAQDEAKLAGAKVSDFYAVDYDTGEQSH